MPIVGINCDNGKISFDKCLECPQPCAPAPLRRGIFDNIQDRGQSISPSLLTRPCLLSAFLIATNDIYLPLERLYQPSYGTAIHGFLEKHANGAKTEIRLKSKKLGISGQIDHYQDDIITDYKSTANIGTKNKPSEEHSWQVNLYAYLARENGLGVEGLRICYLDPKRWLMLPVYMLTDREIEAWAKPKIELLTLAFHGRAEIEPNPCWMCNQQNRDRKIYCETYNICVFNREGRRLKNEINIWKA